MALNEIILPPQDKAPLHTGNIITWMWYVLLPYRWIIVGFFSYRAIRYTWLGLMPVAIGYMIGGLETGAAMENPQHYMMFLGVYMVLFAIFTLNIVFIPEIDAFEKAARGLTLYAIRHINALPLTWHEQDGSGGKLQRVMTGRKGFQEFMRHVRWDFFPLIGDTIAIIVSMMIMDIPAHYGLFYGLFVMTYLGASWYFALPFLKLYDRFHDKFEKLLSGVYEFVSAVRTVKAFHLNDHIIKKAKGLEESGQEAIMKTFRTNLTRWTICNLIAVFWLIVFATLGFYDALNGTITAAAYASMFFMAYRLWFSCEILGAIWEKVYEYGNAVSRLVETLRIPVKPLDLEPYQEIPSDWDTITLKDLSFAYNMAETTVQDAASNSKIRVQGIHDISFDVQRGQKTAFVGASGAGKSTLVKLLMKQMLPDSGAFTVDGVDVRHIKTEDWLSQIGFVPQDVELFNLSIRENILIDREDSDKDTLDLVLRQAALDEFVETLPEGLETVIGERGIKLSGGQRQRLGIARALIRQTPIIIFDEATSSLDSISERKIQTAIDNSFEGRTVFVIAHRLSTVRNVDNIIVLDEGRIVEQGSFDALVAQKGHFAKLWEFQDSGS